MAVANGTEFILVLDDFGFRSLEAGVERGRLSNFFSQFALLDLLFHAFILVAGGVNMGEGGNAKQASTPVAASGLGHGWHYYCYCYCWEKLFLLVLLSLGADIGRCVVEEASRCRERGWWSASVGASNKRGCKTVSGVSCHGGHGAAPCGNGNQRQWERL